MAETSSQHLSESVFTLKDKRIENSQILTIRCTEIDHSLHTLFKQTCIDDNLLIKLRKAEVSNFCATTKITCKNRIVFKQVSPNISLICHWSNKQIAPSPNSHHWLNHCCYVRLVGIFKQTIIVFVISTFVRNQPIHVCLSCILNWDMRKYFKIKMYVTPLK